MLTDFGCNKVSGKKPGFCLHLLLWNQKTGECLKNIPHRYGIKSPPFFLWYHHPGRGPNFSPKRATLFTRWILTLECSRQCTAPLFRPPLRSGWKEEEGRWDNIPLFSISSGETGTSSFGGGGSHLTNVELLSLLLCSQRIERTAVGILRGRYFLGDGSFLPFPFVLQEEDDTVA